MADRNLKKDLWLKYHLNFPITGGYGDNENDAIEILLENNLGILLEKDIIACLYCESEYNFKPIEQKLLEANNRYFDILKVELPNGEIKELFFDISNFFGKSPRSYKRDGKEYAEMVLRMTIRPDTEEEMSWFK